MKKDIRVRPGKGQSILGLVVGCIFVCIGIFIVVPTFGLFGLLWTGIAIAITAIQEDHEEYKSSNSIEDRLKKVEDLYQKGYITKEEYEKKRSDILNDI